MEASHTDNTLPSIEWGADALDDLDKITEFIQKRNPPAAERTLAAIEEKVEQLSSFPKMNKAGRVAGTRELVVKSTYVVVYTEDEKEIVILRVLHGSQQWP
ncbi:type II toxin-antitoxin system RelE/ParE family toxin [Agrobacterium tumefaciens]|uniref:type II toxin-antitoxin system RelE/ParE family toxin n=1 Tax=Agrobacterium tumefaciens TaxID=358 RepID=UPI001571DCD3|nr:type II toxin-antitoxin system RelE/ParE family toxin [Agrobacterium tumefaciens]